MHTVYSEGTIFTATKCVFKSHLSNINQSIGPEVNQPIIEPAEETPPSNCSDGKDASDREVFSHLPKSTLPTSTNLSHPSKESIPVVHGEQASSKIPPLVEFDHEPIEGATEGEQEDTKQPSSHHGLVGIRSPSEEQTYQVLSRSFSDSNLKRKNSTMSRSASLPLLRIDETCEAYNHEERFGSPENERANALRRERGNDIHSGMYTSVQEEVSQLFISGPVFINVLLLYI